MLRKRFDPKHNQTLFTTKQFQAYDLTLRLPLRKAWSNSFLMRPVSYHKVGFNKDMPVLSSRDHKYIPFDKDSLVSECNFHAHMGLSTHCINQIHIYLPCIQLRNRNTVYLVFPYLLKKDRHK